MSGDIYAVLRDVVVLAYMFVLRIFVPLLVIVLVGKWIQLKVAAADRREQMAHQSEPYCWDEQDTAQTQRAKLAAETYPDLPCWLAVQRAGGGVTEACYHCPRYAVRGKGVSTTRVEVS